MYLFLAKISTILGAARPRHPAASDERSPRSEAMGLLFASFRGTGDFFGDFLGYRYSKTMLKAYMIYIYIYHIYIYIIYI
jgi:hypothetical protein